MIPAAVDIVIPTAGRPSLGPLLVALLGGEGPAPQAIVVVDDRPPGAAGDLGGPPLPQEITVVRAAGRGPAAARNAGWRAGTAPWVAFLDDDVVPEPGWLAALAGDLGALGPDVAGSQGRIRVPLPAGRRPTDWERGVAGLEQARWATADMAYRRSALEAAGGFDERFPRAYREDADLALRVQASGGRLVRGRRMVVHRVRPAPASISLRRQAGNADDPLMARRHGADWRERAGAPRGRRRRHGAVTAAGAIAGVAAVAGRRRVAGVAAAAWLAGTAELAWARIAPGPRTRDEVLTMAWTSALMPFAATGWWVAGSVRAHRMAALDIPAAVAGLPAAVLFDRDGTLVHDVPYNGDPARVVPVAGARDAVARLRAAGVALGVVSNQSGIARGLLSPSDVRCVNARIEELLGPMGPWAWCPHGPEDHCACRKPAPGLVLEAAAALGVRPERCAVVGDIGADVEAAHAAGARGVLVPTPRTRPEEITAAPEVAADLEGAVDLLLGRSAP